MDQQFSPLDPLGNTSAGRGSETDPVAPVLLVRSGKYLCALQLATVVETMRPHPVRPVPGAPAYVDGMAIIRGRPVPVVQLSALLQAEASDASTRLVVLQMDRGSIALAVDTVIGVSTLAASTLAGVPPLLKEASPDLIAGIGKLDQELLLVLQGSRIIPEEVWDALKAKQGAPA